MSTPEHPFEPVPGTDARNFIQWKGTDVCLDFYCRCGAHGHVDGDFAYYVRCAACGTIYEMGTQVKAVAIDLARIPDGLNRVVTATVDDD